jgi:subtilisin family serine protease
MKLPKGWWRRLFAFLGNRRVVNYPAKTLERLLLHIFRKCAGSVAAWSALALAACASVPGPRVGSNEYHLSWGLRAVNAQPAYAAGVTGQGVTIALVDCGVDAASAGISRNLSRDSVDLNPERGADLADRHADLVVGPMSSVLDGQGLAGVAYNATVLSIRADFDGGWQGQCAFVPRDIARGVNYAVDHRASVIVLSLRGPRSMGVPFEQALQRAIDARIAIVIAAGNEASANPSWPARYATDPRYAGGIIVAGASRPDGNLAAWSNRAGGASAYYVLAPGEGVITDCGTRVCARASGTSLAAPYVAGAIALVLEAGQRSGQALNGREAIRVLLDSARSAGVPEDVGRGVLDIGRALLRLGRTTTAAEPGLQPAAGVHATAPS